MENSIKEAFGKIHADTELIEKTTTYLQSEIRKRTTFTKHLSLRFATIFTAFALFFLLGGGVYSVYTTPVAYIDMDVNPSVELAVNRFGRVIKTASYNEDADLLLQKVSVRNKPYTEAIDDLLDEIIRQRYLKPNGLVAVTVQSNDPNTEQSLVEGLSGTVSSSLATHHSDATMEVYGVSREIKEEAHAHHVTPAKYIAITELQSVDSSASFETCSNHSIVELREQAQNHGSEHHCDHMDDVEEKSPYEHSSVHHEKSQ